MTKKDENRRVVEGFIRALNASDFDGILAHFGPGATWWILGHPNEFPLAGMHDPKDIFSQKAKENIAGFQEAMVLEITSLLSDGDRVAVEGFSKARMANGKPYLNRFHMALELRDGKISAAREYLDTLHVQRTMLEP